MNNQSNVNVDGLKNDTSSIESSIHFNKNVKNFIILSSVGLFLLLTANKMMKDSMLIYCFYLSLFYIYSVGVCFSTMKQLWQSSKLIGSDIKVLVAKISSIVLLALSSLISVCVFLFFIVSFKAI